MSKLRIPLPKKTERVHKDRTKYNRNNEKLLEDARDIRQEQMAGTQNNADVSLETICCGHCGHEYDRHVGDVCPNCGHNNTRGLETISCGHCGHEYAVPGPTEFDRHIGGPCPSCGHENSES